MKNLLTLRGYFARHRGWLSAGVVSLVVVDGLQLITPRVLKWAVDDLTLGRIGASQLLYYAGLVVLIGIGVAISRYLWRFFINSTARHIEAELRADLFTHLQSLSSSYYDAHYTGDLMAHLTNDLKAVRRAIGMGLVILVDILILGAASVVLMVLISGRLTLYALIPLPVLVWFVTHFGQLIHRRFEQVQAGFSRLTEKVREALAGIRVIKSFVQEQGEDRNFAQLSQEYLGRNMRLVRIWGLFFPFISFLGYLSMALVLWLGGGEVIFNRITMGDFVAFNTYLGILIWPIVAIGWAINLFQRGAASMGRLNRIFEAEPEVKEPISPKPLQKVRGEIEFRNLTFSYPGAREPALYHINLRIRPGEILGVLGRVGSGKSTLADLLLRLYDPPPATVFIDGCDIRELPLSRLRGLIAYVPQEGFLFSDTIRENLCFGRLDASEEELRRAARVAQLESEILEFPEGYEAVLGERGITLSGGQRQRLELARALLLNRPILILDDALSSVDTDTESRILKGMRGELSSRTVLIIAHRISTIRYAHRVVVMDEGRVVEEGTHRELLVREGLYTRIYRIQQLAARLERV